MNFYEVMFLVDSNTDAKEIETRAIGAAERCKQPFAVISVTIHARPNDFDPKLSRHTATVMVMTTETWEDPEFNEFGGIMARKYGLSMYGTTPLDENTLNLKDDEEAIEEFINEALGHAGGDAISIQPTDDEADSDAESEETFNIEVDDDE